MIALTAASLAIAVLQTGGAVVVGHGAQSCGVWTEKRSKNEVGSLALRAWLGGYITGYNVHSGDTADDISEGVDFEGLVRWVDNYCAKHPLDRISIAALRLIEELQRRRPARR